MRRFWGGCLWEFLGVMEMGFEEVWRRVRRWIDRLLRKDSKLYFLPKV